MLRRILVHALLLATCVGAQDLTDDSYAKLRDSILPTAQEQKFREIPWLPTFWDAALEGQEKVKPILLWAMNGHPLACT